MKRLLLLLVMLVSITISAQNHGYSNLFKFVHGYKVNGSSEITYCSGSMDVYLGKQWNNAELRIGNDYTNFDGTKDTYEHHTKDGLMYTQYFFVQHKTKHKYTLTVYTDDQRDMELFSNTGKSYVLVIDHPPVFN